MRDLFLRRFSMVRLIIFVSIFFIAASEGQSLGCQEEGNPTQQKAILFDRPDPESVPTKIYIGLYLLDLISIDDVNQSFTADLFAMVRWNDPRLAIKDPSETQILRNFDLEEIWHPLTYIINQRRISKQLDDIFRVDPAGNVQYIQRFLGDFSSPLDFKDFPFDKQRLTLHLVAAGLKESEVRMVPLKRAGQSLSGISAEFSMPDFKVTDWRAETRPYLPGGKPPGTSGFILEMDIERLPNYYIWKVILPLCLIVMMSWIPRWLDPAEGGTSIGISTTAFLTLVAYLFAIVVLLPKVAYLTRLDRFILISTVLVFASLVQTVATTYLVKSGRTVLANQINWSSRFIYPILLMLVLAASFA